MKPKVKIIIDDTLWMWFVLERHLTLKHSSQFAHTLKHEDLKKTLYILEGKSRQNPYPYLSLRPLKNLGKSVDCLPRKDSTHKILQVI